MKKRMAAGAWAWLLAVAGACAGDVYLTDLDISKTRQGWKQVGAEVFTS